MPKPPSTPVEIERKFLVSDDAWRKDAQGQKIQQGYLSRSDAAVVRVRIYGEQAFLTVKGKQVGITSPEFEYEIPLADAAAMLEFAEGALVEKTRYRVEHAGHTWEVDEFEGLNRGLILAEIELDSEDELFSLPSWVGREVSQDPRFKNSRLSLEPYRSKETAVVDLTVAPDEEPLT
jgi:adenylate cyclase